MDSTLEVTPEGSLSNLPAPVGGAEDSSIEQRTQEASEIEMRGTCPSTTIVMLTEETPNTSVKTVTGRDSSEQWTSQVEPPRRAPKTREASQEDAFSSARHFCYVGQYGGKSFKISLSSFSCLGVIYCIL